jgi:hypothetical protein
MKDECPVCTFYVSNWQEATNKTIRVNGQIYHKSCLIDYKLRYGKDYITERHHGLASNPTNL